MWKYISCIVTTILLVAEGVVFFRIWDLKMLPMKYFLSLLAVTLIINIPIIIMMFPGAKRVEKFSGKCGRIVAYVLSLIFIIGSLFGWNVVARLDTTFDAITQKPSVSAHVGVYVLADDSANTIEDISKYTFAMTDSYDTDNGQAALSDIQNRLGTEVSVQKFDTVFAMVDALYAGDVQAMILNVAYTDIFDDVEHYRDFSEKTKKIYQYEVSTTVEKPAQEPTETPTESTVPPKEEKKPPFIVYLSGSDTRSNVLATSRSDVNILAVVNPENKQILLVNTPRDYFIPNPAGGGALDKLTHCGIYGIGCSVEALSDLYGYPIDYNAQINFTGFETLIDAIGGINIVSDVDDGVYLRQGDNHMDGKLALKFARDRFRYSDGDHARGRHQMLVIKAVVEKMSTGAIVANYSDILDSLQEMFVTDMPSDLIAGLIKDQLSTMVKWDVLTYAVAGAGGSEIPYSMPGLYAYVMYPDQGMVDYASGLIGRVLDGETLTQEDISAH